MDRLLFSFPDKDLRPFEACAQPCSRAVSRAGTTSPAASRLWTTGLLCRNFPQGYPLTRPKLLRNSLVPAQGIHCSILEQSVVSPLKTTTWESPTEQCLGYSQRYPGFVGRTLRCSARRLLRHEAVGTLEDPAAKTRKSQKKSKRTLSLPGIAGMAPQSGVREDVIGTSRAHRFRFMTRTWRSRRLAMAPGRRHFGPQDRIPACGQLMRLCLDSPQSCPLTGSGESGKAHFDTKTSTARKLSSLRIFL